MQSWNPTRVESELCRRLVPCGRILEVPDTFVWCCSPIFGEDGRTHVFFSRWPREDGFGGWVVTCEIWHAVADRPEGPYTILGRALAGRGGDHWDSWSVHNPTVHRVGDKYALFYMGSDGSAFDITQEDYHRMPDAQRQPYYMRLVESKRVGLAVADSLDGPWTRVSDAGPLLPTGPEGAWDDVCTTNPAFLRHPNGECWLYYKAWDTRTWRTAHGNRKYGLAVAKDLTGPYVKHPDNPLVDLSGLGENTQCEDAYIYQEEGVFHMVMRDMGVFDHAVGLHFTSQDGLRWEGPRIAYREAPFYFDEPLPGLPREGRIERPQILMRDGHPAYLFGAYAGGKYRTASAVVLKVGV